jgi:hypothetical protein
MSTNAIEECLAFEKLEEEYYNQYIMLRLDPEHFFIIVDPYLVNMQDLQNLKPGRIVRLRRPGWGRGVKDCVKVIRRRI